MKGKKGLVWHTVCMRVCHLLTMMFSFSESCWLASFTQFINVGVTASLCLPHVAATAMNCVWQFNLAVFTFCIWGDFTVKPALKYFFGNVLPICLPYTGEVFNVYLDIVSRDLLTRVYDLCETVEDDEVEVFHLIEEAFPENLEAYGIDASRDNAHLLLELALSRRNKVCCRIIWRFISLIFLRLTSVLVQILGCRTLDEWEQEVPKIHVRQQWQQTLRQILTGIESTMSQGPQSQSDSESDIFEDALEELLTESENDIFEDALEEITGLEEESSALGADSGQASDGWGLQAGNRRLLPETFSSLGKRRSRESSTEETSTSSSAKRPRNFRLWTSEETSALEKGLSRFGRKWVEIKNAFPEALRNRTNVQIMNKARNEFKRRVVSNLPLEMYKCMRTEPDGQRRGRRRGRPACRR